MKSFAKVSDFKLFRCFSDNKYCWIAVYNKKEFIKKFLRENPKNIEDLSSIKDVWKLSVLTSDGKRYITLSEILSEIICNWPLAHIETNYASFLLTRATIKYLPLREPTIIYRCVFCRKSFKRFSPSRFNRHAEHCFKNPARIPYLGEITDESKYEFLSEEGDRDLPAWWPGDKKIWDGKIWRDIPGCFHTNTAFDWPDVHGADIRAVRPWAFRLEIFDDISFNKLHEIGELYPLEDEKLINFMHNQSVPINENTFNS